MQGCIETMSERQWIEQVREGNSKAFEAIFRTYYNELCDFVEFELNSPEVAEDIVQGIFCDVWQRREEWYPGGTLKAYLYRAARNQSIKQINRRQVRRRWKQREKRKDAPQAPSPEDHFRHRELKRTLEESIGELPDRRRQVYVLSRQHGLTYKEIAEVMEISPKTVDRQMVAALKFLRERLSTLLSVLV